MVSHDDENRSRLRGLLLDGAASPRLPPVDASYFARLRDRARGLRSESADWPSPSIASDEVAP